jgi:hypothetical protein
MGYTGRYQDDANVQGCTSQFVAGSGGGGSARGSGSGAPSSNGGALRPPSSPLPGAQ